MNARRDELLMEWEVLDREMQRREMEIIEEAILSGGEPNFTALHSSPEARRASELYGMLFMGDPR